MFEMSILFIAVFVAVPDESPHAAWFSRVRPNNNNNANANSNNNSYCQPAYAAAQVIERERESA